LLYRGDTNKKRQPTRVFIKFIVLKFIFFSLWVGWLAVAKFVSLALSQLQY